MAGAGSAIELEPYGTPNTYFKLGHVPRDFGSMTMVLSLAGTPARKRMGDCKCSGHL